MKFGVVAFPAKKLQDVANSYRKRYDPHYDLITPHMTLKDAFEVGEDQIEKVVEKLDEIVKRHKPFKLHATRVSTFSPLTNTLYFKIEPNPEILSLHEDLHKDFYSDQPKYSYVPHVTIAQKMSDSEHSDIFGQLKMVGIDHEEIVDRIHLLYQLEDGSWTVYDTFRLSGDDQ